MDEGVKPCYTSFQEWAFNGEWKRFGYARVPSPTTGRIVAYMKIGRYGVWQAPFKTEGSSTHPGRHWMVELRG